MNDIRKMTDSMYKKAIRPAAGNAYRKMESVVNSTEEVGYDPSERCFTYKAKNGFGFGLDWEHETVSANWTDVVLSFCWKDKRFKLSRLEA